MKFSQRIGVVPAIKTIQLESLDADLRNGLWNIFNAFICGKIELNNRSEGLSTQQRHLVNYLWHNIYKLPADAAPSIKYELLHFFRTKILEQKWYHALELIEEVLMFCTRIEVFEDNKKIESYFNEVFEREFSAYRFINGLIAPISNKQEITGLEEAFEVTKSYTALIGCNTHLEMALRKLSDKYHPDYRNSIKESISAVESLAKLISGKPKDTLGASLDRIKGTIKLHEALERGFKQLYGYTSDEGGIRHALMDSPNCDFDDAKYMLISCSAFINYLISKANKAGIPFG